MLTKSRLKDKVAPVAKQMEGVANTYRLAIVYLLSQNDLLSRELVDALGLPQNLVSHHLKVLLSCGWVTRERAGKKVTYRLNKEAVTKLQKLLGS